MILMINDRFYNEQELRQLIQSQAEELKDLREENKVLISECDRLIKEKGELLKKTEQIRQLKKMLLQACSDFDDLSNHGAIECSHYLYNARACDGCPLNSDGDECKWIYEAEVLALIGEDGEQNG